MPRAALHGWHSEVFKLALGSLRAHKLRGGLTILGIVIGITSVVGMVSLVEGLNRSMRGQLDSLGADTIWIRRFDPTLFVGEVPDSLRKRHKFTRQDAEAIRAGCPSVLGVSITTDARERLRYEDKES